MKKEQQAIAVRLRKKGFSLNAIQKAIKASKSSISLWVRGISLNPAQQKRLKFNQIKKEVIEKRRNTRLANSEKVRAEVVEKAKEDIHSISLQELKIIGCALYWAEGAKTQRNIVRFSNGDPEMIALMMMFFRNICRVDEKKFRGYIHIHPHLDTKRAEQFWSKISEIPLKQFFKTYNKPNKSSKNIRDTLPFGTFEIYVCDTNLFLKIQGWSQKIKELRLVLKDKV